jgi:hypothetical protein
MQQVESGYQRIVLPPTEFHRRGDAVRVALDFLTCTSCTATISELALAKPRTKAVAAILGVSKNLGQAYSPVPKPAATCPTAESRWRIRSSLAGATA